MCQSCGFYNGRQMLDLQAEKAKRDARIQAKKERMSAAEQTPAPEGGEVVEEAPKVDDAKAGKEENLQDKRPEKKVE